MVQQGMDMKTFNPTCRQQTKPSRLPRTLLPVTILGVEGHPGSQLPYLLQGDREHQDGGKAGSEQEDTGFCLQG